jgi:glutaredoxin
MKLFFKAIRLILGPIVLFINWITMPKSIVRPIEVQRNYDALSKNMVLYQFKTCPFCIKVRRENKRLALNIETRDAQRNQEHREQLLAGGGRVKVPCLKTSDENGNTIWMYDSKQIIQHLQEKFA